MNRFVSILYVCLLANFTISAQTPGQKVTPHQINWQSFLAQHDMVWDQITADYYAGAIMGNGFLGTNFYKSADNSYRLNIGRVDVTEGRGGVVSDKYTHVGGLFDDARLPVGYFLMTTKGTVNSESMRLSIYDAVNNGTIKTDKGQIEFKTYVHATKNYILFETEATGEEMGYAWEWKPLTAVSPRTKIHGIPEGYTPNPPVKIMKDGAYNLSVQNLLCDKTYVVAWKELKTGNTRRFVVAVSQENTEKQAIRVAKQTIDACLSVNKNSLEESHNTWWHNYYPASFATFPNSKLESFYWLQQYKFACATRKDKMIVDLQGPWASDNTPWPGVWMNLNIQLTYSWQNTVNRPELTEPLWKTLNNNLSNLITNVTKNPGQEKWTDAAAVGRSCSYDLNRKLDPELADVNQYEVGNLTWTLFYYWQYCIYNNKTDELKAKFFPLLKRAIAYYSHIRLTKDDGKYHLPKTASPEYKPAEDCNYDLSLLRWGLVTLLDINSKYKLNDPLQTHWTDFLDKLVVYPEDSSQGFIIGKNVALESSHRHYSHLLMIHPLYLINWEQTENQDVINKSINHWQSLTGALQGYSFTGSSAMYSSMGDGKRALTQLETLLKKYIQPNTLYKESGPVIETPLAAVASINDMYIQSWGGKIRVFPAVPQEWSKASFINLRTEGAFLVSASREAGKTVFIQIESEAGGLCRLQTGMNLNNIQIRTLTGKNVNYKTIDAAKGLIEIPTQAGDIFQITDKMLPAVSPAPIEHPRNEANPYGVNSGYSKLSQNVKDGNEQGMELGMLQLHQDSVYATEALNGWWKDSQKDLKERMEWYNDTKFGCFVHWGPYSSFGGVWQGSATGGYAEHLMRIKKIPVETYKEQVVKTFNPTEFNADEWVLQAKEAGMKYFIVTAKHHDGFAMYNSDAYKPEAGYPSYDANCATYDIRMTPFDRDPMAELRVAAKKYGLKFGFYYSHAFDWEHPDAPGNDWDDFRNVPGHDFNYGKNPGGDHLLGSAEWWTDSNYYGFLNNANRYVEKKSIPQILELVEKYEPDIMWFDTPHKLPLYQNIRICKALREAKTDVVINGRLARWGNYNLGDYANSGDRAAYLFPLHNAYWESIPTTNNSYGYSSTDNSYKPASHFIRLLATAASKGGNILLNVGPMGNGKWDTKDINIFKAIGEWLNVNGEAIYGTVRTNDIPIPNWGVITRKDNTIYLHVHQWNNDGVLWVGGLKANVREAKILTTGQKLQWSQQGKNMRIEIPVACPDTNATVIALTLDDAGYQSYPQRLLEPKTVNTLPAFDAILSGTPFSKGDGKVRNNYLHDWKDITQTMTWNVSAREPVSYEVTIEYSRNNSNDEGTVILEVDGKAFEVSYTASSSSPLFVTRLTLDAGEHIIRLRGKSYTGSQYMRPVNVTLAPM